MPAASPFGAMLLLGLLKQRAFALDVGASLSVLECENEIVLGQINKTFCVEHVADVQNYIFKRLRKRRSDLNDRACFLRPALSLLKIPSGPSFAGRLVLRVLIE